MWDPDFPPIWIDGQKAVDGYAAVGVDVSAWRPSPPISSR
jgi:hypothetical protein